MRGPLIGAPISDRTMPEVLQPASLIARVNERIV
jgi:hypothetical protein